MHSKEVQTKLMNLKKSLEVVEEVIAPVEMGVNTKADLRNYAKVKIVTKYL
jgi:hypothetical protein